MEGNLLVAAYARVSTEQDDQMNSLASQKSYFAEFIRNQPNMEFSRVYYDEGISGTQTNKRAGFHQMITDALQGKCNLILTKEVSRFARNTVDTLYYTRKLKEAGVGVIFTIDNIDTRDTDGELRLTIMASLAQEESRKTSERVKWGQKRRMEQGVVFGRDLLGYTVKNGVLSINEKEVPIVKAIFHKYTNEKKGTYVIARELLEEGFHPKHREQWSHTVILRVLRNEKYVGDLCQKKTYTPDYLTHKKQCNHGQEEKVYIKNHHEGIIDRTLWNRTQNELQSRSPSKEERKRHSNRYWCSGKIHCGECGCHFISRTKKTQSGTYRAWWCFEKSRHGIPKSIDGQQIGCSNRAINEKALLACMKYSLTLLCDLCGNRETIRKDILTAIKGICNTPEQTVDLLKLKEKINTIEKKKRKAIDAMLDGVLSKEDLQKQTQWYNEELETLHHLLLQSEENKAFYHMWQKKIEQLENSLDQILAFGGKNEGLYQETLEKITVYREEKSGYNRLVVWLKSLPFGIQLRIRSTGRGEHYVTEILETTFLFP